MNLNKVILIGRLTRDPQLRFTPQGTAVAEMGLAVNRSFTDGSGQKREETCFVDVVMWQKQAETCAKYLRKGSPIFVEGRLSYDSWEGNDGQRRSRLRVVAEGFQFMDSPQDRRAREESTAGAGAEPVPEPAIPEGPADQPAGGPASDIPF